MVQDNFDSVSEKYYSTYNHTCAFKCHQQMLFQLMLLDSKVLWVDINVQNCCIHKNIPTKENTRYMADPGLSLRAGGRGFPPATTSLSPGYLYFDTKYKMITLANEKYIK